MKATFKQQQKTIVENRNVRSRKLGNTLTKILRKHTNPRCQTKLDKNYDSLISFPADQQESKTLLKQPQRL